MPTKMPTAETQPAPISTPKTEPKRASKRLPKTEAGEILKQKPKLRPQRTPKTAPITAQVTAPETNTLSIYLISDWESDHSISPHRYGNGGKQLGEFHTEADAKEWLKRNDYYGHFAAVERINGKIGKSWHIEIEPLEEEPDFDDPESDLGMLDDDDLDDAQLLNPDVVRAKIENAKLKAELKAASRNGAHSSIGELLQGIKTLDEMRGQGTQQKSLAEQLREYKEVNELISPRREQPQQTAPQPQLSDDAVILNALANNDAIAGKVKDLVRNFFSDKSDKEEISFADVAMEAIRNGQAAEIVKAAMGGFGNLLSPFMPSRPEQQPTQAQQTPQPSPTETASSPQIASDSGGEIASQRVIGRVLSAMAMNADVEPVINAIDGFRALFPEHQPMIENLMSAPPEAVLQFFGQNVQGATEIISQPHALAWLQKLQAEYLADDGDVSAEEGGQHE